MQISWFFFNMFNFMSILKTKYQSLIHIRCVKKRNNSEILIKLLFQSVFHFDFFIIKHLKM